MDYNIVLGTAGWGVWHSPDAGKSWVRHRAPFPLNSRVQALVVLPGEPAAGTNEQAVLFGDPSKPGPYVVRIKWLPGNMSRPHFHPNDRFFAVISGTWWMGTGETFDPDSTVPAPAGSYVIHYGGKVHYDGAKGEEAVIQVWGMGPATATPAGKR